MSDEAAPKSRRQRRLESMRPWYEIWWSAISQPKRETFDRIVEDARTRPNRVFWWLILGSMTSGLLVVLGGLVIKAVGGGPGFLDVAVGLPIMSYVLLIAGFTIMETVLMLALAGLIHVIASILGGRGPFMTFLFVFSAAYLPIVLLFSVLLVIPLASYTAILVAYALSVVCYMLGTIMIVYATRAAYSIGTGRAYAVAIVASTALFGGVFAVASMF